MRCFDHVVRTTCALALALVLSSCDSLGDLESLFDKKKPLPGERKPVFSDGVPGVPQGIPPELVRGYKPPPEAQPANPEQADQQSVEQRPAEKPTAKPKARPRPATAAAPARPPTVITVQPGGSASTQSDQAAWPAPPPPGQSQQQRQGQQGQWPAGQDNAPAAPAAPSPWPAAPAPGTFSR